MSAYKVLLVKLVLNEFGSLGYPDFNSLQVIVDSKIVPPTPDTPKWARFFDVLSVGPTWHQDNKSPLDKEDDVSPRGTLIGMTIVPAILADQAAAKFPALCEILDDAAAKSFYETRSHFDDPDEDIDGDLLQNILYKVQLDIPLTALQTAAKDPTNNTKGLRANPLKTWDGFKGEYGL